MAARKGSSWDRNIAWIVFAGVLAVYVITLCPTVYPGASLNAVMAATNTELVRSVDYPVWQFLSSNSLMWISSNKAWALNLFSAVCGAAAIGLLFRLFSRFGHTRTRDELVRYRGQPNLARWAALSAALLVAFSHTFWRASVTAGTDTLNVLMLMLVTHFLVRYRETRKKRYFMGYAIVYSVALANFPSMLLLLPIYLVLSIMWCREAYADLITLGATILISAALFAAALFSAPAGFAAAHRAEYFLQPLQITRPVFDYLIWYWNQIRPTLPMGGIGGALQWLLGIVLPTLPPVLYLTFTKPERRGGEMGSATAITDGILRFLAFAYTLFGLLALFDLVIGPYSGTGREGFLVVYVVVGGWVCYMLGYWVVLFTSRSATSPDGRRTYSRPAYAVLVAIMLVLPAANLVKHMQVDRSGLKGFTLLEDFANDTITSATAAAADASTEQNAVILVYDNWGSLLRYVHQNRISAEMASKVQIVDVAGALALDTRYLDKNEYLRVELYGQPIGPRDAQTDPARSPDLSTTEAALRYMEYAARDDRTRASRNVLVTADRDRFDHRSAQIVSSSELVPQGLVYRLVARGGFASPPEEEMVASGLDLWGKLRLNALEPRPVDKWPPAVQPYLLRASKLANDFGVYCHKYAGVDTATQFYEKALDLYDMSYSAIRNLLILYAAQEPPREEDTELKDRLNRTELQLDNQVTLYAKQAWAGIEPAELEQRKTYVRAFLIMSQYGLVRDAELLDKFVQNYREARASQQYTYGFYGFRALVDPKGDQNLLYRGAMVLGRQGETSIQELVVGLMDVQRALAAMEADPTADDKNKAMAHYAIGRANFRLRNYEVAEASYRQAIALDPRLSDAKRDLAALYASTNRLDEAMSTIDEYVNADQVTNAQEMGAMFRVIDGLYTAAGMPGSMVDFVRRYAREHETLALDAMLYLVERAFDPQQPDLDTARSLLDEIERDHGTTPRLLVRKAQLADREKRFADVLAIEISSEDRAKLSYMELSAYLLARGTALYELGEPVKALEDIELAYATLQTGLSSSVSERERALAGDQRAIFILRDQAQRQQNLWNLQLIEPLAAASFQAWVELETSEAAAKALGYAANLRGVFARVPDREIQASAAYGWAELKINKNIRRARALLERAYLGFPNDGTAQFRYAALLIAEGDYKGGVALLRNVLDDTELTLNLYDAAEAKKLIDQYGAHLEESPGAPDEPGSAANADTPTEPDVSEDAETTDTGTDAPVAE
ncbi:MAG: DUF2723 domain-containing protein [Verrucomicrobia bacterium]|nr:DUF2723 domain-containing protein [Verrucomicrobiota bacterium]